MVTTAIREQISELHWLIDELGQELDALAVTPIRWCIAFSCATSPPGSPRSLYRCRAISPDHHQTGVYRLT